MPDDNIFSGDNHTTTNESTTAVLDQLVGEGKKFNSVEDLAKGKLTADTHIDNLENQNRDLKAELDTRLTAEKQINQMLASREEKNQTEQENTEGQGDTTPSISADEIAKLVRDTVDSDRKTEQAQANEDLIDQRMKDTYGDKAKEVLESKAKSLGVSTDFLKDVARQSPDAFFATIGLDVKQPSAPRTTSGTISTDQLVNNPVGGSAPSPGTYKWYDQIRKSDPSKYWSSTVQKNLFADRQEKGQDFYK